VEPQRPGGAVQSPSDAAQSENGLELRTLMATTIWAGLAVGAVYALVAIGYNVVLLASGVFNFAHAQLIMLGTYMAFVGGSSLGLPALLVIPFAAVVVGAVAVVEERVAIRPLMSGRRDPHAALITTIGAAVIIDGIVLRIWGIDPRTVKSPVGTHTLHLFGGTVQANDVVLICAVVILGVGLHLWSRHTLTGLASLASAEDRDAAMARGVNVRLLGLGAFLVAGLIAGAAGILVGAKLYANAGIGDTIALFGFVAIAIGGSGSQLGGLIGGLSTGIIYALVERYSGAKNGADWANIIVFLVFLFILFARPRGLFGGVVERQV
jgi:branched-chain amino acid transport system permease protein